MAWPLPSIRFSKLFAVPLIVALAGCQGREHYAYQLDSIPLPSRVAMKKLSPPDCTISNADLPKNIVLKSAENKSDPAGPAEKRTLRKKANLVDQLRWERDCYRNAELRVRERLHSLQASTAVIVSQLRNVKHDLRQPMRLHPPERPMAEVSRFERKRPAPYEPIPSFQRPPKS